MLSFIKPLPHCVWMGLTRVLFQDCKCLSPSCLSLSALIIDSLQPLSTLHTSENGNLPSAVEEERRGHTRIKNKEMGLLFLELKELETSHWYSPASFSLRGAMLSLCFSGDRTILLLKSRGLLLKVQVMSTPVSGDMHSKVADFHLCTLMLLTWR